MKPGLPRRLLGILPTPEGATLVALCRTAETVECEGQASAAFAANAPAEDIGRAIREALHAHGLHRNPAVLCVPPHWCTTRTLTIPAAAEEKTQDFLRLQAEAHLSPGGETLAIAYAEGGARDRESDTLLIALPSKRLRQWQTGIEAAGLEPRAACPALLPMLRSGKETDAAIAIHASAAFLQISDDGVLVGWQSIRLPRGDASPRALAVALERDLRIILAEYPASLLDSLDRIRIVCPEADADLAVALKQFQPRSTDEATWAVEACDGLVTQRLVQGALESVVAAPDLVFRDQRVPVNGRSRRRLIVLAVVIAAVIGLGEATYAMLQTRKLAGLRRMYSVLEPDLAQAGSLRDAVRKLRPWYGRQPQTLDILRDIATAFPKTGSVTLTQLSISDNRCVTLAGQAVSAAAWLTMQNTLRECPRISNLTVTQTREAAGSAALSFSLTFDWHSLGNSS